jgi:endonuclease/exonuclease/phosphatase family metal-dependent hydrolase
VSIRIRIATFNLENLDETPRTSELLDRRIAALRPQLLRLDADVLCLQEVSASVKRARAGRTLSALDRLLADTPYADFTRAVSAGPHGTGPADVHNLVTLSRWRALDIQHIRHDMVPPLRYTPVTSTDRPAAAVECRFDRPILYVRLALPNGAPFHVLNVHLRSPLAAPIPGQKRSPLSWRSIAGWAEGFFIAALKRSSQALEARLFLERIFDAEPHALLALCGDFNADGREVPVRTLLGDVDDTGNPALTPRSLVAVERSLADERRYSVRHAGQTVMLDHILVSRSLQAWTSRTEVHNEALADEIFDAAPGIPPLGSFHAPVVAEFTAPAAASAVPG